MWHRCSEPKTWLISTIGLGRLFFTLDEAVWLSVGLEPADCFKKAIKPFTPQGNTNKLDDVGRYMSRHKEQFRREFDPYDHSKKISAAPLIEWIEKVNFPVHVGFVEMLSTMTHGSRGEVNTGPVSVANTPSKMDNREIISLAKLMGTSKNCSAHRLAI